MVTRVPPDMPLSPLEAPASHPTDSSRLLMSLLSLVQSGWTSSNESPTLDLISVPVLRSLLSAIHFRDAETLKHARRVGLLGVGIASRLGWEEDDLRIVEIAALLHDLGKLGIPDHILRKPGRLGPDEAEFISVHHRAALGLLQACQVHPDVLEMIAQAHGLDHETEAGGACTSGLGARILAVADAYDSLTTRQVFRPAFDRWEALQILEEQSGKQFDRNVVAAMGSWLDSSEAAALVDEQAANSSIQLNAPVDEETRAQAGLMCQIFNYLYLLESLYEAFYVIDRARRVVIWNSGAATLFGHSAATRLGRKWDRRLISTSEMRSDAMEQAFRSGQPQCHTMMITDPGGNLREIDVQSIPILGEDGRIAGVAELLCDRNSSHRHGGQFRRLQIAASRDALTGVFNRGELEGRLKQLFDSWESDPQVPFSLIFLDLDHFKAINDRYSHGVGDRVLVDVARLVQDELYSGETIGRYGGEEFVVLCPETPLETAIERAERLRRKIMAGNVAGRDDLRVSASLGVTQAEQGDTLETLLARADEALYDAKRQGRNRTCHRSVRIRPSAADAHGRQSSWVHNAHIITCIGTDLLPLKMKGFVEERAAELREVSPRRIVMTIGASNTFGGWGRTPDRQPVQLTIDIQELPIVSTTAVRRADLNTVVQPIGRPADVLSFQRRASAVVELLRSYLMAD